MVLKNNILKCMLVLLFGVILISNISATNYISSSGDSTLGGTWNFQNITVTKKITFAFAETIDNIIDGWIRITGGLNVTENLEVGGNITTFGNINITNHSLLDTLSIKFQNGDSITGSNSLIFNISGSSRLVLGQIDSQFTGDVKNVDDIDGISRFSETNLNGGKFAVASITTTNSVNASLYTGILSSAYDNGNPELRGNQTGMFSISPEQMGFGNGFFEDFVWNNNPANDGNFSYMNNTLMRLDRFGNLNVSNGNLSVMDKINFRFGEVIDNLVDGWLKITGSLNVTGNMTANNYYGEMWGKDIGTVNIVTQNVYVNATNLTEGFNNGFTFLNSTLTTNVAGLYKADSQWSMSDGANIEFHIALGINNVAQDKCHAGRRVSVAGDVGSSSFTCLVRLSEDDLVTLMVENSDGAQDPSVKDIQLNLLRIGN